MVETTTVQPSRRMYQGAYRQELDTEDPANPADPTATPTDPAATPTDPALNPEERTYKNRYDSLKAHYDKKINETRTREAELIAQLGKATQTNPVMPKTPEEFLAWRNTYPDLYGMLVTAIRTEMKGTEEALNERINQAEVVSRQARRDRAESALIRLHPDFNELRMDEKFHEWVKEQPADIQKWLYDNEDDPLLAARAVDLYKADTGKKVVQVKKPNARSAADAVTINNRPADSDPAQGKQWKVSDIRKLTPKQYSDAEADIDAARREGRLIIDA